MIGAGEVGKGLGSVKRNHEHNPRTEQEERKRVGDDSVPVQGVSVKGATYWLCASYQTCH